MAYWTLVFRESMASRTLFSAFDFFFRGQYLFRVHIIGY